MSRALRTDFVSSYTTFLSFLVIWFQFSTLFFLSHIIFSRLYYNINFFSSRNTLWMTDRLVDTVVVVANNMLGAFLKISQLWMRIWILISFKTDSRARWTHILHFSLYNSFIYSLPAIKLWEKNYCIIKKHATTVATGRQHSERE